MAPTAATTKRCPGFDPGPDAPPEAYRALPHTLPADIEHFNSNKGSRDGLSARCRVCGNAYGKAWAAAKKAGTSFSLRAQREAPAEPAQALTHQDGSEVFTGRADQVQARLSVSGTTSSARRFADPLAQRLARKSQPGWALEVIGGVEYALPTDQATVDTIEGQAALQGIHEAKAADRRRRNTEQKRASRAAARAAAQAEA
jgi:hypothetical protein